MGRTAGLLVMATLLLAVTALPARAQTRTSPQAIERSIWDGVYTRAQAQRGDGVREAECGACHSANEWARQGFMRAWSGRTVRDLVQHLRSTMPYDGPGRLSLQQYTDIVAYMLRINGVPAGQRELKGEEESLRAIRIDWRDK